MLATSAHVIVALILFILLIAGLAMVIVGLPGIWVMVASTLIYTIIYKDMGWWMIIMFTILGVLAEGAEFLLAGWGARRYGSSSKGMIASIVGGIIGAIVGSPVLPVIGTIIGAFLGSFVGAFLVELLSGKRADEASRAGFGALVGRAAGITAKAATAIVIIVISAIGIIF